MPLNFLSKPLPLNHQTISWLEMSLTWLTVPLKLEIDGRKIIILIQNLAYLAQVTREALN